ncbi:MAG: sigma-70 family RNA polymerase sigma factor [Bacteroidota bacterium]
MPPLSAPARPFWEPLIHGLRAFVARRVPAADVDDVVQDLLLRLHESAPTLRQAERAEAWVYGIARRTIADFYRRRKVVPTVPAESVAEAVDPADEHLAPYAGDHDVHEEVLSWLRPMAEALPDGYREALVMADFEGQPQQAVADVLGLTLSGAKSRIQRARRHLAEALQACCTVEFGPDGRASAFQRRTPCASCG